MLGRYTHIFMVVLLCLVASAAFAGPKSVRVGEVKEGKTISITISVVANDGSKSGGTFKIKGISGGSKPKDVAAAIALHFSDTGVFDFTVKVDPNDPERVIVASDEGYSQPTVEAHGKTHEDPAPSELDIRAASLIPPGLNEIGFAAISPIEGQSLGGRFEIGVGDYLASMMVMPGDSFSDVFAFLAADLANAGIPVSFGSDYLMLYSRSEISVYEDDPGLFASVMFGAAVSEPSAILILLIGCLSFAFACRKT